MGGLFDSDVLEDDDYVDGYDDEELADDEELGIDYHEILNPEDSQSQSEMDHPEAPYNAPAWTGGEHGNKVYYPGTKVAVPSAKPGHSKKKHRIGKLPHKLKKKHKAIVIHHHNGRKTILV